MGGLNLVRSLGLTTERPAGAAQPSTGPPRSVWPLTCVLGGLALLSTVAAERVGPAMATPSVPVLLGFLLAMLVAGTLNLEYHYRGHTDAFDHFEAALLPALYFLPPVVVVLLAVTAKIISQAHRRVVPTKAVFNVAQWGAAVASGALACAWLDNNWPGVSRLVCVAVAVIAVLVVNALAVLFVLALAQRQPPHRWLPERAASLLRNTAGTGLVNITFGLLFVAALRSSPGTAPLLLVPLALLHWASRGHVIGRVEQARLRTVRSATSALAAKPASDDGLADFLTAIGSGTDREVAQLIISTPDGLRAYVWRNGAARVTVDTVPLDRSSPLSQALLALVRPVRFKAATRSAPISQLLRAEGRRECVAAPLRIGEDTTGVLALYDARSPVTMPEREVELVAELAREAGAALERRTLLRAVLEERAKMSQIVNETSDGIVTFAADGMVTTWNRALETLTGFSATDVVGKVGLQPLSPTDSVGAPVDFSTWASAAEDPPDEVLMRTRTGESRYMSCSYARGANQSGHPDRLIVLVRDVSALKRTEAVLAGHAAVLELIASGAPVRRSLQVLAEALVSLDEGTTCAILIDSLGDGRRLQVGAAAGITSDVLHDLDAVELQLTAGWPARAMQSRRNLFISDVETDPVSEPLHSAARAHGVRSVSAMLIRASDHDRTMGVLLALSSRPAPEGRPADREMLDRAAHLAAIAVARGQFEAQLAHQATHDALTGLRNRVSFMDRCEHALSARREGPGAAVFFVDLDRFKIVNDEMGHDAGDQLLKEVAERMRRIVRPGDTVARFGGDEFTVLCDGCDYSPTLSELVQRIHGIFRRPFSLAAGEVFMTASIGVAVGGTDAEAGDLVNRADIAMYRAKERGGNCYEMFDVAMRRPAQLSVVTHNTLHRALSDGELVVVYQPMVSLSTGSLSGVEALLRWQHPENGLLMPEAFLPFAESSGLIVPIGAHVVTVACEQARQWAASGENGTPLTMNINLSARELGQDRLVDTISAALDASKVSPDSICFEITESALLHDVNATTATLRRLKDLGVHLSIDDFGTGYASLTYLRRFPVDSLKVDRSFINGVDDDPDDRAIVTAVISLARSLGLEAVGEGVETARQLLSLQELGCDIAQGYYLAKPTTPDKIVRVRTGA